MRKAIIIVLIIVIGTGGYLGWDWYDKTRKQKLERTTAEKRQKCVQRQRVSIHQTASNRHLQKQSG